MANATQNFLSFDTIHKGVIVMPNQALRGILMVSSINFALKSEEEKESIIYQFQNFLNSLDFKTQILVTSRKANLTGYLEKIEKLQQQQPNKLMKTQTKEYYNFINKLLERQAIMSKQFYAVVPYSVGETKGLKTSEKAKGKKIGPVPEKVFGRARTQLRQRMEFVAVGLKRASLNAVPLTSSEIIELLWSLYHPRSAEVGYYPSIMPELLK